MRILSRPDGSYVITKNGMPYHVTPDMPEFAEIDAYAKTHPGEVQPEPVVPTPEPTPEEVYQHFVDAIQKWLDDFARTRRYDNIMSACTYATSANSRFQREGQYCVEARDATWEKGYQILDDVMSGKRPMPTVDEVLAELPKLEWPE